MRDRTGGGRELATLLSRSTNAASCFVLWIGIRDRRLLSAQSSFKTHSAKAASVNLQSSFYLSTERSLRTTRGQAFNEGLYRALSSLPACSPFRSKSLTLLQASNLLLFCTGGSSVSRADASAALPSLTKALADCGLELGLQLLTLNLGAPFDFLGTQFTPCAKGYFLSSAAYL